MIAEQEEVDVSFEVLAVTPERAVVNWWVHYTDVRTKEQATVNGVSVGRFDVRGCVKRGSSGGTSASGRRIARC